MKLIDRYVAEVGKRLPLVKGRGDIEKELRSTLEDMLEDRAQKAGRPADETMEIELLKEYGDPNKVAATYNPHPYLIGPRMFPFFIMILKIVAFGVTVGLSVVTVLQIFTQTPMTGIELVSIIGKGIGGIISAIMAAFGYIVLAFAIIERVAPANEFKMDEAEEWNPASLMKEPEPNEVKPWEPILAIVFTFIVLGIFNFNPQLIGVYIFSGEKWTVIPALTDAFFRWMPLINVAWIAGIILNGILLRTGRWQTSTRLFFIAIKILEIVIGFLLLTGPTILAITPETLQATGIFNPETSRILGTMAQQGIHILIAVIILAEGIDLAKTAYKMVTEKSPASALA